MQLVFSELNAINLNDSQKMTVLASRMSTRFKSCIAQRRLRRLRARIQDNRSLNRFFPFQRQTHILQSCPLMYPFLMGSYHNPTLIQVDPSDFSPNSTETLFFS